MKSKLKKSKQRTYRRIGYLLTTKFSFSKTPSIWFNSSLHGIRQQRVSYTDCPSCQWSKIKPVFVEVEDGK